MTHVQHAVDGSGGGREDAITSRQTPTPSSNAQKRGERHTPRRHPTLATRHPIDSHTPRDAPSRALNALHMLLNRLGSTQHDIQILVNSYWHASRILCPSSLTLAIHTNPQTLSAVADSRLHSTGNLARCCRSRSLRTSTARKAHFYDSLSLVFSICSMIDGRFRNATPLSGSAACRAGEWHRAEERRTRERQLAHPRQSAPKRSVAPAAFLSAKLEPYVM